MVEETQALPAKVFNLRETRGMSIGELAQLGELINEILADSNVQVVNTQNNVVPVQPPQPLPPGAIPPASDGYVPQRPTSQHAYAMDEA